jgi:hypothetical protein
LSPNGDLLPGIRKASHSLTEKEVRSMNEAILQVAKAFGNTAEDLERYGGHGKTFSKLSVDLSGRSGESTEAVLQIGKLFGNTPEDIQRYGSR